MARYRFVQFSNLGWGQRLGLAVLAVLGVAVALAFVLLSVGFAIVLVPIMAVAWLVARWRLREMLAAATRNAAPQPPPDAPRTIEVEYRVLGRDEHQPD
jgi:hypothetical protein